MFIKMMCDITTFKNIFQYQMEKFNSAKTSDYFCNNLLTSRYSAHEKQWKLSVELLPVAEE